MLSDYQAYILTQAATQAIIALGLYLTLASGQFSVAHAALMGVAGYASGYAMIHFGVPFPIAFVLGALAAALLGSAMAGLVMHLDDLYLGIATLAFGETIVIIAVNSPAIGGSEGMTNIPRVAPFWLVWAVLALLVVFFLRLEFSRMGLALRAVRADRVAAATIGVRVRQVRLLAFAVGGLISGIGGVLYGHIVGVLEPRDLSFAQEVNLFLFVILGGIFNFWGAILGAFAIYLLLEVLRFELFGRYIIFGIILAGLMILRPQGLLKRRPFRYPWRPAAGKG